EVKAGTTGSSGLELGAKTPHLGGAHAMASWSVPSSGLHPPYPNTDTKRETTRGITAAMSPGPPSASTDVISTPAIPHGVMAAKPLRSRPTLSANPCQVTQRLIATPTDAILRDPHHTPASPGRRSAPTSTFPRTLTTP